MTSKLSPFLLLPLIPFLAGCGDDDPPATFDQTPPPAETGVGMATPTAGVTTTVVLGSVAPGSAVAGEATMRERGAQTEVQVTLTGSTAGSTHQGHVHTGSCDAVGGVASPLQPVTVGSDGRGTSESVIDLPIAAATDGGHIVVYHEAGGSPGSAIVCGDIPSNTM